MSTSSIPTIDRHDDGPVRVLTIANEARRNAFSGDMAPLLYRLFTEADADPSVRAIVVTGAGTNSFSSGHDLAEVLENPETAGDPVANAAFTLPPSLGTPVIGAINGNAYAAGFILALNCDLRVASSNARFCAVGAKIGLVPVGGQLSRLLHVVTYPVAFKLLATAVPMGAEEALACNLVTEVCEPEETVKRAVAHGQLIAEASPAVVRAAKTGLRATLAHGMDAGQALEPQLAEVVRTLPDGDEGVASFLEKRPANYPDAPTDLQKRLDAVVEGGAR
jgi:enoyl-CoA hydratase/carnithine racemase